MRNVSEELLLVWCEETGKVTDSASGDAVCCPSKPVDRAEGCKQTDYVKQLSLNAYFDTRFFCVTSYDTCSYYCVFHVTHLNTTIVNHLVYVIYTHNYIKTQAKIIRR